MIGKNLFLAERFPLLNKVILKSRIAWSIHLRWVAVAVFSLTIVLSKYTFKLDLLYSPILKLLVTLAVINLVYYIIFKVIKEFSFLAEMIFLTIHIIVDLLILTALINLSGGMDTPLYLFYLIHVLLASIILPRKIPYFVATFVVILFSSMLFLEYAGIIKHYSIFETTRTKTEIYNYLVFIIFTITTYICTYITTTFMKFFRTSKSEIDILNKKLIKADQEKTVFFRYASHELKSPIVAVKSAIDGVINICRGLDNPKPLDIMQRASVRASQMLDIINELLELSRNREFKPDSSNEIIDINAQLKAAFNNEIDHAGAQGIEIEFETDKKRPLLTGRQIDLEKAFSNLINNAVRYNVQNGNIKINSQCDNSQVIIKISDSGIGIPKEDLDKVFSEFYRSENAKKHVSFGTGLGLSLVKQIIENYNGKIKVESEAGKGTTFVITLPVKFE